MTKNEESIEIRMPDIKNYQSDQLDWPDDAMVLKVASDVRHVKIDAYLPNNINTLVLYRTWKKSGCMCVCLYVCVCVRTCVCLCVCVCVELNMRVVVHVCACTCVCSYVCVLIHVCVCLCVCVCE